MAEYLLKIASNSLNSIPAEILPELEKVKVDLKDKIWPRI